MNELLMYLGVLADSYTSASIQTRSNWSIWGQMIILRLERL